MGKPCGGSCEAGAGEAPNGSQLATSCGFPVWDDDGESGHASTFIAFGLLRFELPLVPLCEECSRFCAAGAVDGAEVVHSNGGSQQVQGLAAGLRSGILSSNVAQSQDGCGTGEDFMEAGHASPSISPQVARCSFFERSFFSFFSLVLSCDFVLVFGEKLCSERSFFRSERSFLLAGSFRGASTSVRMHS